MIPMNDYRHSMIENQWQ